MNKLPKSFTTVTTFSKVIAMILFIALPFVGFYLGMQYQKIINPKNMVQIERRQFSVNETPTITQSGGESIGFKDPRVSDMNFTYDTSYWNPLLLPSDLPTSSSKNLEGPGILISEINSSGYLHANYSLSFGSDGGVGLLIYNKNDIHYVSDVISRVRSHITNNWVYGIRKSAHLFGDKSDQQNPDNMLVKYLCPAEGTPPQQGNLNKQDCNSIKAGEIIGYTDFPTFGTFARKPTIDFNTIQSGWEELVDGHLERSVIMRLEYSGTHPEKADEIVTQLTK